MIDATRRPALISRRMAWKAVVSRDDTFDHAFVYAVTSTRIYCRPSCPARRPISDRVRFFETSEQAELAGYRECRRCRPRAHNNSRTAQWIDRVRQYLRSHLSERVTLATLAKEVNLSAYHLQRIFTRTVGVSPVAYQRAVRAEQFKSLIRQGYTITQALYEVGFGSSSRLYDRTDGELGMLPRIYRSGGKGVTLRYATARVPVGHILIAVTTRGIAAAKLAQSVSQLRGSLKRDFPHALLRRDQPGLSAYLQAFRESLAGGQTLTALPLDVPGTAFQWKVWKALQGISRGHTQSYQEIARSIGHHKAARAVARACATNRVALVIPCHRAIGKSGQIAGYRWGVARKGKLLALERR